MRARRVVIDSEVEAIKALVGRVDAAAVSGRQATGILGSWELQQAPAFWRS